MIIARKINYNKETEITNNILVNEGILDERNEDEIKYVLEENNKIIGVSKVTIYNNIGTLNYIVIIKEKRGEDLGDGLLRSILNSCDLNNIKRVYYLRKNNYLIKKGFKVIKTYKLPSAIRELTNEEEVLAIELTEFFSQCCNRH